MDSVDRFGLEATFSFTVNPNTTKSIKNVLGDLEALQNALKGFAGDKTTKIPDPFAPHKGGGGGGAKKQINDLKAVKSEFRALRAESRNIDFGDLNDPKTFDGAKKGLQEYIRELETLKSTIKDNTAAEREFKAQLEAQQRVAENKIDIAGNQRTAAQSQQRMGIAGTVAATGAAALVPLVSIGKDAINIVRGFDAQIAQARAVSGASVEESLMIRNRAKELGAATKFSASEAAGAFVSLGQAGYNANQQMAAIDGTLMLAAAGAVDLGTATDITVSTLGGFQAGAEKASHYANVLAQTANAANLGVTDLGETMKYAAPSAKAFGSNVEQTAAMAGILANAGIKASSAGTAMRTMFMRLGDPVKKAAVQLRQYHIATTNADGSFREMPDILADINKALSGATDEKKAAFYKRVFGAEASNAAMVLTKNLQGLEDLTQKNLISSKAFGGMGVAARQAEIMGDNIDGAFVSMGSAIEGVFIDIADVLKSVVLPAVKSITGLARGFTQLPQPIKTAIVVVGGLAAGLASLAAIGGTLAFGFFALQSAAATAAIGMTTMATAGIPLTGFFGTVMTAFSGQGIVGALGALGTVLSGSVATALGIVLSPLGLVTGGLLGLYAVLEYVTPSVNILGSVLSAIATPIGFITGLIKGFATTLFSGLGARLGGLSNSLGSLSPVLGFLGDAVKIATDTFAKFFNLGESSGAGFANVILTMVDVVVGAFKILWGAIDLTLIKPIQLARATWGATFTTIGQLVNFGVGTIQTALSPLSSIPDFFRVIVDGVNTFISAIPQIIADPFGFAVGLVQNTLTAFTALPEYFQGIITQIQSIVATVTEFLTAPFRAATSTINSLWDATGGRISGVFNMLTGKSEQTGYDLVGNLAEHSPGTTWQIREKWGMTADTIAAQMEGLVSYGEATGKALSGSLVLPDLGELALPETPTIGAINSPQQNSIAIPISPVISPAVMTADVIESTKAMPNDALQLPTDGVVNSVSNLVSSLGNLQPVQSILTNLQTGFDTVKSTIQGATLSAVGFAVTGAVAIAPLILGIAGLGVLVAGIAFNFLGLRDIITGVGSAVWSILEAGKGVAIGLVQVFQGVIRFVQSIPSAITGDFSLMGQSLRMVWQGISTVATSFVNGVIGVFNGLSQSVRGIFTGLGQIIEGVFFGGWYRSIVEAVNNSLQTIRQFGQNLSSLIGNLGNNISLAFSQMFSGNVIVSSLNAVRGIIQNFGTGVSGFINGLEISVRTSFSQMFSGSFIGTFLTGLTSGLNRAIGIIQGFVERGTLGFHGLFTGIQQGLTSFIGIFQNTMIGGWFNSLTQVLTKAKEAISSFVSSITSALNKPIEAVGNTANKIKGMLGIKAKAPVQTDVATPSEMIAESVMPTMTQSPIVATAMAMPTVATISPLATQNIQDTISPVITTNQPTALPTMPELGGVPAITQQVNQQLNPLGVQDVTAIAPNAVTQNIPVGFTPTQINAPALAQTPEIPSPQFSGNGVIGADQVLSDISGIKIGTAQMADTVGNSFSGVGQLLSMVSPQLAAPVMGLGSVISTGASLGQTLGQLKTGIAQFLPSITAMFPAIGGLIPMITGLGTSMFGLLPGLGAVTAGLSPLLAGLLPVIAVIGGVVAGFFLLKAAFDNNFLGLRDAVDFVVSPFVNGFEFLKTVLGSAVDFLGNKLTGISTFFRETVGSFVAPIAELLGTVASAVQTGLAPVFDVLKMFIPILSAIGNTLMTVLVLPFKTAGLMISIALKSIVNILKPVVGLIGTTVGNAFNTLMMPIRAVLGAVDMIRNSVSGVIRFFTSIPTMIGGLFANLWNLIPAPIKWLVENAMGGVAAIGGAFTKDSTAVPQFATGGLMANEGLAYLHPNEFVVNPEATAGNMGALTQLNNTGTLPTAIRNTPIPVPVAPPQNAVAPQQSASPMTITIPLTFGDIIIQNATDGVQAAKEFLDNIKPQLDRTIRDSLREMTELAK